MEEQLYNWENSQYMRRQRASEMRRMHSLKLAAVKEAEDTYRKALMDFVNFHYGNAIPENLGWHDYQLLYDDLNAKTWAEIPEEKEACHPWVKERLHDRAVIAYHREEFDMI